MSSIRDEISRLRRIVDIVDSDDTPIRRAAQAVHAKQTVRIFEDGKSSTGSSIGSYKQNAPVYVNPKLAPKSFAPRGKNGDTTFKNGKKHKTGYFPSWGKHREAIGREGGKVNLRYSNDLQSDFANATVSKSETKVASPEPTKIETGVYATTLNRQVNIDKKKGLEAKYGDVFKLTEGERSFYIDVLDKELQIQVSNA